MMLPLIVVPTVAMLKPAGNPVGMVTDFLSASSEGEGAAADDAAEPGAFTDADEFSDFFNDSEASADQTAAGQLNGSPFREEIPSGSDAALMNEAMNGFTPDFSNNSGASGDDFPFSDDSSNVFSGQSSASSGTQTAGADSTVNSTVSSTVELNGLLTRVQQTGASEVMWFQPGASSHGFIAFFHNTDNGQILRFEGVAFTKAAAVKDVLLQIQQRQRL